MHFDGLWEEKYRELAKHKASHLRGNPKGMGSLAKWCKTQQSYHHQGKLREARVPRLREAGFDFSTPRTRTESENRSWDERYLELLLYRSSHQGKDPSGIETRLTRWCYVQRKKYQKGTLAQDQRAKLEQAGFSLSAYRAQPLNGAGSREEQRNLGYRQLKDIYLETGHFNATPLQNDSRLLEWFCSQRKKYHDSKLSEEKQPLLKEIDFPLGGRPQAVDSGIQWEKMTRQLLNFTEEKGRRPVVEDHPELVRWIKAMLGGSQLNAERKDQLQQLLYLDAKRCSHEGCTKYLSAEGRCSAHI